MNDAAGRVTVEQAIALGMEHHQAGRLAEAEGIYRQVLGAVPGHAGALHLLGVIAHQVGRNDVAEELIREAIGRQPGTGAFWNNLGQVLRALGKRQEAVAAYRRAGELSPGDVDCRSNLAIALRAVGRPGEAVRAARQAVALDPNRQEGLVQLAVSLVEAGELDAAAVAGLPGSAEALLGVGAALGACHRYEEAVAVWRRVVEMAPADARAHNNIAAALTTMGAAEEGLPHYRRALEIDPSMHAVRSNMLLDMHYVDSITPEEVFGEHVEYGRRHGGEVRSQKAEVRRGEGKLRVGYFSPDFRAHSVADFIAPVLAGHDRSRFEVVCYANVAAPDVFTERLKGYADVWREVVRMSDEEAAGVIREDRIDILVDLAGHTAHGRMLMFARRPAPAQITYLGYPDTTGLAEMDWRMTDVHADPVGMTEHLHVEKLLRLPRTAWCYHPYPGSPAVAAGPVESGGVVTFGSFNNLAKVSPGTVALWSQVLQAVPGSRMVVKAAGLSSESARRRLLARFEANGVSADRVELIGRIEDFVSHLAAYGRVDVGLDTYPYHGTTTTCEAIYMGVPVVTLAGRTHVSRVGVSLLTNVGLGELVAGSEQEFVRVAAGLGGDVDRLRELRGTLRGRMERSPLMDAAGFVRDLEQAYRRAWGGSKGP